MYAIMNQKVTSPGHQTKKIGSCTLLKHDHTTFNLHNLMSWLEMTLREEKFPSEKCIQVYWKSILFKIFCSRKLFYGTPFSLKNLPFSQSSKFAGMRYKYSVSNCYNPTYESCGSWHLFAYFVLFCASLIQKSEIIL